MSVTNANTRLKPESSWFRAAGPHPERVIVNWVGQSGLYRRMSVRSQSHEGGRNSTLTRFPILRVPEVASPAMRECRSNKRRFSASGDHAPASDMGLAVAHDREWMPQLRSAALQPTRASGHLRDVFPREWRAVERLAASPPFRKGDNFEVPLQPGWVAILQHDADGNAVVQ